MNQNDILPAVVVVAAWILLIALPVLMVVRHRQKRYIKSFCPDCDNPIEFPARGLGQSIECPHCQSQIVLREISSKEKLQRSYGWLKPGLIVAFVCVLLLCGAALFIYQDSKAQQLKRDEVAAALEAKKARDAAESNVPSLRERIEQARVNTLANMPAVPDVMERFRQRSAQHAQEDIADELRRANDIADQQSLEQSQQNQQALNEIRQIRSDNEFNSINSRYQPQNQSWILKYNSFENRWQYAPPNATLKYNGLENRWEFVPQ